MQSKIYIGKSNRANPDDLIAVRNRLSKFDVEIVEFTGGAYSHKPMLECDVLIIVPDLSEYCEGDDYIPIGKGLHEQISAWNYQNKSDIFILVEVSDFDCYLMPYLDLDLLDNEDYINYSSVILDDSSEPISLNDIIPNRFGDLKPKNLKSNNGNFYVLIDSI